METENVARGGGGKTFLPALVGVVVGLLIGGPSGAVVGAPLLVKKVAGQAAAGAHGAPHESGDEEAEGAEPAVYVLDDIVLNPAGTDGSRFLIARVAVTGKGETFAEKMKLRDSEIRDVVVRQLGAKGVPELADAARRDAIKKELLGTLQQRLPGSGIRAVLFPQFVIQ
ncbi:MAG: flagellar basal body-associated FliL family protein [Gemmatimonadetes bacterium]|nr:flagellar basal body-associated FliL family protein [Gemmatimonadota bacterium]